MWLLALLLLADSTNGLVVPVAPGESLHATVTGQGDPVVLIPGLFGSTFAFRNVVPPLVEAGYRVIIVEPLGIGASARPKHADYSLTAQADRIATVLDSLGVRDAILVAHSLGASMALRLAYRRPELGRAILSLEGGPTEAATTPSFRRAMRFAPLIKLFGGVGLVRNKVRSGLIAASGDPSWITDATVDGYTAGAVADLDGTLGAFVGMAKAREPEQLAANLGRIRCPVLLLVGTAPHEAAVPQADIAELQQGLRAFTIDSVSSSGHYIHEEQPGAVVAAVARLRAWLLQRSGARSTT